MADLPWFTLWGPVPKFVNSFPPKDSGGIIQLKTKPLELYRFGILV